MRTGVVQLEEVLTGNRRLTGGYYLSEDELATRTLRRWKGDTTLLLELAQEKGIYSGGIFRIIPATDSVHGVPYVSAKDIVHADIRPPSFISRRHGRLLNQLVFEKNTVLVTCSGMNLGKVIFVRPDLEGLCGSGDLIRIKVDETRAGFVYAYLSSRFGWASLRKLIFGGHIKHIEPKAVATIPIPRLDAGTEKEINSLILDAAADRSEASQLRSVGKQALADFLKLPPLNTNETSTSFCTFSVDSNHLRRFDAAYHNPFCVEPESRLASHGTASELGSVSRLFVPGFFKRVHVDDPKFGHAYFSGSELFQADPKPRGHLSKRSRNINEYLVKEDWLLIQDAGQLGGLIGRVMRVSPTVAGAAISNHLVRVVAESRSDAAYLFTVLDSPYGYRAITRRAFGTSIPQLESSHLASIRIPWPKLEMRETLGSAVRRSWELNDRANASEKRAITLLETRLESGK